MAKEKNGTTKLIITIVGPIILLIGGAVGYGKLYGKVEYFGASTVTNAVRIDANVASGHVRDLQLRGVTKDITFIKEAIVEQKAAVHNQTAILKDILKKLPD